VTGFADIRDMLRPVLSLLIDTIAKNVLALADSLTKRLFFILDEFSTLQRLDSLVELLTLARSKGGSVWLAAQDLSQVENIYGPLKNTIVNACGTKVLFAVADPHDAKEFSEFISEAEYLVETVQDSGVAGSGGGLSDSDGLNRNYNRQLVRKNVVLPSNIMNMPKFSFIFRSYPYSFVKSGVKPEFIYENRNERLVLNGREEP
jgi:type IV secretory pathway TraG/TraD family ATPase VirD4